ncbi:hypothetical protein ANCCAN_19305 [Ancylostoma caninum]|uniref:Uncharacterized protein n=1 Tax=Ancylostoma caninum TaxID=29170 RepID=A0A368FRY7_ANCCA|nr:hypothetical protein ANCCAN_19305 [Ancylostoma caninum]
MHFKEILQALPKQRRNGLFSATQAKEMDDLSMFGLRNKKVIKIKQSANLVSPSTLNNFYTVCEAAEKLMCVVEFVRNKPDKKILLFFPSCGGVKYFYMVYLDVSGLAHAYGLLRLPKMRELSGRKDLDKFQRSDIDTSTIKYANPALERKRSEIMAEKHEKKLKAKKEKLAKKLLNKKGKGLKTSKDGAATGKDKTTGKESKALKRKIEQNAAEEKDDFENDVKLLKKMKKGRLSKKELRDVL